MCKPSRDELQSNEFYRKHLAGAQQWMCREFSQQLEDRMNMVVLPLAESPFEAAFLAWWVAFGFSGMTRSVNLLSQQEIAIGDQRYRLDFVAEPSGEFMELLNHKAKPLIGVELDGHDYHEKTKEQVTYRNQRDRALTAAGWLIWHYSGSEFNRDPESVVSAVFEGAYSEFCKAMRTIGFWRRGE